MPIQITEKDLKQLGDLIAGLPIGEQVYIEPLITHAKGRLELGEVSAAIDMLKTFPLPTANLQKTRDTAITFLQTKLPKS